MTRAERVIEARRMKKDGEFDRAVVSSEPDDLSYNWNAAIAAWAACWETPLQTSCHKCAEAWIEAGNGHED